MEHLGRGTVTLLIALLLSACTGARVISPFGALTGSEGYPRVDGPHNGIDVAGLVGTPVLAVAEGTIVMALEEARACGTMVRIRHLPFNYESTYCHLSEITMRDGAVRRGDMIGRIGTTGRRPGPGYEHVHLNMKDPSRSDIDPEKVIVGCFDPKQTYPADRFVATYPVPCKN